MRTFFMKEWVYNICWWKWGIKYMLGLENPSIMEAFNIVSLSVFGMRDGGKLGIITPMHIFVCRKLR